MHSIPRPTPKGEIISGADQVCVNEVSQFHSTMGNRLTNHIYEIQDYNKRIPIWDVIDDICYIVQIITSFDGSEGAFKLIKFDLTDLMPRISTYFHEMRLNVNLIPFLNFCKIIAKIINSLNVKQFCFVITVLTPQIQPSLTLLYSLC